MSTFMGKKNAINNLYENASAVFNNVSPTNYTPTNTKVDGALAGIDTVLGQLKGANVNYIDTTGVTLTGANFGQTILVDTFPGSANIAITAPDPNGLTDQVITFINSPSGTKLVTVTSPTGGFGKVGSSFVLYPGDTLKLMTLSALGYQILTYQNNNGSIFSVYKQFNNSQSLALGTNPQQLVAAPGANQIFNIFGGWCRITVPGGSGGIAFASGGQLQIRYGITAAANIGSNTAQFYVTADSIIPGFTLTGATSTAVANAINQAMNVGIVGNTNFTTGNGSIDLFVKYSIMSTSF